MGSNDLAVLTGHTSTRSGTMRDETECAQNGLSKGHDVPGKEKWEKDCLRIILFNGSSWSTIRNVLRKVRWQHDVLVELSKLYRSGTRVVLR